MPRSSISVPPEPLFRKHGTANGWPWLLKWLEHSAWIRRLGVRVSLRSTHFLSQNLWHFHKNICLCVENECCCPCTVKISNVDLDFKNICTARASLKKTWDSKCMALVAQMVRAFGMNPKVRCSSFPQVETFYASKTLVLSQEHPFLCRKRMLLPRPVKIWNGSLTSKIFVLPEPVSKTLESKSSSVQAFALNPKVGGSSSPQVEIFSVSKTLILPQEHPSVVGNECCCTCTVNLTLK